MTSVAYPEKLIDSSGWKTKQISGPSRHVLKQSSQTQKNTQSSQEPVEPPPDSSTFGQEEISTNLEKW